MPPFLLSASVEYGVTPMFEREAGFILGVTNSIRNHFPWENTLAMLDEWKKVR